MITAIATIFVLGILIFFHELGHFMVAKWAGIRVDKFSLGFPPTILSRKWGETEYAIGAIPLGGYVKMAGDNPAEELTGKPWEFMSKPVWKRFWVVFAGPLMNFILAVVVLTGLYTFRGREIEGAFIDEVDPDKPAAAAGIMPGDQILTVDGTRISSFRQMAEIIYQKVEEPVVITWRRQDQTFSDTLITARNYVETAAGDSIAVGMIGIGQLRTYDRLNLLAAVRAGFDQSLFYSGLIFKFVGGLFTGTTNPKEVGGPIFIAQIAGAAARSGISPLLEFLALLSVNLAVLNILPIPVFDGGHIGFLIFEKLKGAPPSLRTRMIAQQIGIAFILFMVVFVTFNDLTR